MSLLISFLLPTKKDDSGDHWVTVNGQHILIGSDGNPKSGNVGTRISMRLSNERDHVVRSREQLNKSYRDLEKAQRVQDVPSVQASALGQYTDSVYGDINKGLRSGNES